MNAQVYYEPLYLVRSVSADTAFGGVAAPCCIRWTPLRVPLRISLLMDVAVTFVASLQPLAERHRQ